jgi:hypothetical protein
MLHVNHHQLYFDRHFLVGILIFDGRSLAKHGGCGTSQQCAPKFFFQSIICAEWKNTTVVEEAGSWHGPGNNRKSQNSRRQVEEVTREPGHTISDFYLIFCGPTAAIWSVHFYRSTLQLKE